jgi:altronate dehydratase
VLGGMGTDPNAGAVLLLGLAVYRRLLGPAWKLATAAARPTASGTP